MMPAPDPHRWSAIVRRLLVHARALGASCEEAEDLVHDTVERIVRDPTWYDEARGELLSALKVMVRNRWFNRIRARGVRQRAAPHLRVVEAIPGPDGEVEGRAAAAHRQRFLALLEPEERSLFRAWLQQRSGAISGPEAARSLQMSHGAYEAAKKRLRRRCRAVLDELGLEPADLFDPVQSGQLGEGS